MPKTILTITRPDDFHLHLRQNNMAQGDVLASVLPFSSAQFARATIMPNLTPPVTNGDMAVDYKKSIEQNLSTKNNAGDFTPLMTLYLHHAMDAEKIAADYHAKKFFAIKYYPKGATTNSDQGIGDIETMTPILQMMARENIPLLIHGEYVGRDKNNRAVDIFDREAIFIDTILSWLLEKFPALKISLEHITTRRAVAFLKNAGNNLGATITAHHLLVNRNDMFRTKLNGDYKAGLNPHHYCLPVAKREEDREALLDLATSGFARVYGGTDSAPHPKNEKESPCGCAGVFSAPVAVESYAMAFDQVKKLSALENFLSNNGAAFFGLPKNQGKLALVEEDWQVAKEVKILNGPQVMVPFMAGEGLAWKAMML
ncbi:MAG: dihydroorotase [Hydrotalea sp.]|nr:dihydroorotase [Hydrotalea sp.]